MDESYRKILLCLVNTEEIFEPQKELREKANDKLGSEKKIHGVNNVGQESKDRSGSEVEILESEAIIKVGNLSNIVPSKRHHKNICLLLTNFKEDSFPHLQRSSEGDELRKQLLNVLRKPFDKEEYIRHGFSFEFVVLAHYLKYLLMHADLRRKLTKYQHNQRKHLTIYRGFFFWLQIIS
ncbi:hypothetical protein CDL12_19685 [Handroanthus impetiginosus]|uniref:Uncharacterized protein n=1 Tax=Handroanthus impetiginosus TaxID=429701 RepID=A0A2G9GRA6_9LAMI|nr:hypothetical protein CDL12_19685 [Handroanthus impetiginosus]